ncbi:MAG: hypothetical protein QRY72_01045 [Candidatus Rhabdochlamydia sp.]
MIRIFEDREDRSYIGISAQAAREHWGLKTIFAKRWILYLMKIVTHIMIEIREKLFWHH